MRARVAAGDVLAGGHIPGLLRTWAKDKVRIISRSQLGQTTQLSRCSFSTKKGLAVSFVHVQLLVQPFLFFNSNYFHRIFMLASLAIQYSKERNI